MKTRTLVVLLLAVFLTGCGSIAKATPTPLPTVVLGNQGPSTADLPAATSSADNAAVYTESSVRAAGFVVPVQEAQLASITGGKVQSVDVSLGDTVKEGQVLVHLAGEEALTAAVDAATVELLAAEKALRDLKENAGQTHAAAMLRLANAEDALDEARKHRAWKEFRNGSQSTIDAAQADVILAKNTLEDAEDAYSAVEDTADDNLNRAAALSALSNARKAYDRAVANLNYLLAMPDSIAVDQAEAELQAAQAEVESAQAELDRLQDGLDPDVLALAEARVKNAQSQLKAGQTALDDLQLKAPFDGTVSQVSVDKGEWAVPGQPVVGLVDLSELRVETTDLSERDVPKVKVGQSVRVLVKALDVEIEGTVRDISPQSDTLGGDVVYKTVINLGDRPDDLYSGMSVDVFFDPNS